MPKSALNVTKGNLKAYTYYGDSGMPNSLGDVMYEGVAKERADDVENDRESGQLLLLPQLYYSCLPSPRRHGPGHDRRADRLARRRQGFQAGGRDFWEGEDGVGAGVCADVRYYASVVEQWLLATGSGACAREEVSKTRTVHYVSFEKGRWERMAKDGIE